MKKKKKRVLKKGVTPQKDKVVPPVSDRSPVMVDTLKWDILSIVFLCLVTILLYFSTLGYPFHFDDFNIIVENPYIKSLNNISLFIKGFDAKYSWFRAFPTLTFALNYHFHKLDVFGYHLINMILHMGSGVLVYLISKRLFALGLKREGGGSGGREDFFNRYRDQLLSLFVAMVFVVHPIQVNTVTYIVQRYEGMASFFYLLGFFLFMRGSFSEGRFKVIYFCGAGIIFFFAILSKEISFTLPLMMILFDLLFVCRGWEQVKRRLRVYIGCGVVLAVYLLFFLRGGLWAILFRQVHFWTPWENLLTQANVIIQYIRLLFLPWPGWLNVDHDFRVSRSLFEFPTFLSVLGVLFLFFLAIYCVRKNRLISFGVFWFFIVLAPTSSLIPIWDKMVEYRLYLPMLAYGLIFVWMIYYFYRFFLHRRFERWSGGVVLGVMVFVLCLYSVFTIQRNQVFKDGITFWEDAVKKSPNKARAYLGLGGALHFNHRLEEARGVLETALTKEPKNYYFVDYSLGRVYNDLEDYGKAILHLEKYLKKSPNDVSAYQEIGNAYLRMGSLEKAQAHFRKGIEISSNYALAYTGLGDIFIQKGMIDEAIYEYKKAIRIEPGLAIAYFRLGEAYIKKGMVEEASLEMEKAMSIDPSLTNAYSAIGATYLQKGKLAEAFELFKKALEFNPKDPEVYNNLGIGYRKRGEIDQAIVHYRKAIELKPNFFDAHINLGEAYQTKKMGVEAIMEYKKAIAIDPRRPEPYNHLGVFLLGKGKIKDAIIYFEKAVSIDPKYGESYFNLAVVYYHQKNFQKASLYCKQASDLGYAVDPRFLKLIQSHR